MNSNDILRRLRYSFELDDSAMIKLFEHCNQTVTRTEISAWLKREDDPDLVEINNTDMATFLNGFIISKRGKQNGKTPEPEKKLNNNIVFSKLKIALNLQSHEILALLKLAGLPISKHELSAFFRKNSHKHYRTCKDQILRHFLKGIQMKYHDGIALPELDTPTPPPPAKKEVKKPSENKNPRTFQWPKAPPES